MVKRALHDYALGFRWRNLVQLYKKSMLFVWILLFNFLNTVNSLLDESTSGTIVYLVWSTIFLFGLIGMTLSPLKLPKVMFLSPMNEQERKQYIQISFWVQVLIPTLMGSVIGIFLLIFRVVKSNIVILSLLNLLICLVFCAIEPKGFYQNEYIKQSTKSRVFSIVGVILSMGIELSLIFWEKRLGQEWNICHITIGVAMVTVGIMTAIYLKKLPKHLEIYAVYEENR